MKKEFFGFNLRKLTFFAFLAVLSSQAALCMDENPSTFTKAIVFNKITVGGEKLERDQDFILKNSKLTFAVAVEENQENVGHSNEEKWKQKMQKLYKNGFSIIKEYDGYESRNISYKIDHLKAHSNTIHSPTITYEQSMMWKLEEELTYSQCLFDISDPMDKGTFTWTLVDKDKNYTSSTYKLLPIIKQHKVSTRFDDLVINIDIDLPKNWYMYTKESERKMPMKLSSTVYMN